MHAWACAPNWGCILQAFMALRGRVAASRATCTRRRTCCHRYRGRGRVFRDADTLVVSRKRSRGLRVHLFRRLRQAGGQLSSQFLTRPCGLQGRQHPPPISCRSCRTPCRRPKRAIHLSSAPGGAAAASAGSHGCRRRAAVRQHPAGQPRRRGEPVPPPVAAACVPRAHPLGRCCWPVLEVVLPALSDYVQAYHACLQSQGSLKISPSGLVWKRSGGGRTVEVPADGAC